MESFANFLNVVDILLIVGSIAVVVSILIIVYRAKSKENEEDEEY